MHSERDAGVAAVASIPTQAAQHLPPADNISSSSLLTSEERQQQQPVPRFHDSDPIDIHQLFGRPEKAYYTLQDFISMWNKAEIDIGISTEDLEQTKGIRGSNRNIDPADSVTQAQAQYGRITFEATDALLDQLQIDPALDVYVDIGHGIGNTVFQAAYTRRCDARGIEMVSDRDVVAKALEMNLKHLCKKIHLERDNKDYQIGNVEFVRGRLEAKENRVFLTKVPPNRQRIKAFCNNYNGVFQDRSARPLEKYYLDDYNAGLFALMPPGSILITLHPLNLGVPTRSEIQKKRLQAGLDNGDDPNAGFYEMEKVSLGEAKNAVTWASGSSKEALVAYKYTRLSQQRSKDGAAVFLCWNPECSKAENGTPIPATKTVNMVYSNQEEGVVTRHRCDACKAAGATSMSTRSRNRVK